MPIPPDFPNLPPIMEIKSSDLPEPIGALVLRPVALVDRQDVPPMWGLFSVVPMWTPGAPAYVRCLAVLAPDDLAVLHGSAAAAHVALITGNAPGWVSGSEILDNDDANLAEHNAETARRVENLTRENGDDSPGGTLP